MSFPRYPKYKDSGVEWLGEVPVHWEAWKLSHAFEIIGSGTTPSSDHRSYYDDGDIAWLNTGDLNDGDVFDCEKRITAYALEKHSSLKIYPPGSLAIAMYGATIGKLGMLHFSATVNQACCIFSGKCHITPGFLFYWLLGFRKQIVSMATGGGQPNISQEILRNLRAACPAASEQASISDFLDRETTKLDNLMAEQEKLIALLKEKRQAVIAHAVTKGLDPTVPMKDSGVEWLGEMPTHWQLKRVKHCVNNFDQGWSPQCESYPVASEDEWGVLKVGCVNGGIFNPEENKSLPTELDPLPELGIRKGDLLISRANTRELVGSAAVALRDYPNLLLCDKLYRLRLDGAIANTEFVAYYFSIGQARGQIELSASGASSSMLNISQATILDMTIALPADEEQKEIVAFIESEQIELKALISEAQHAIDLLKERRTALISAAVTGQIDVRGLIKDEQEQAA